MAALLFSRLRGISRSPPFSSFSNSRFYSKATESFDKQFYENTPPNLDLMSDFYIVSKKFVSHTHGFSMRLSGFWVFNRPKTPHPHGQKSVEDVNLAYYRYSVSHLISYYEHTKYRGIPVLYPGKSGSVDRFGEIGLHTDDFSCYILCCKQDLYPVAIRAKNRLVVVNSVLFKEVVPGYSHLIKKHNGYSELEHNFSRIEEYYSTDFIVQAVQTLTTGLEEEMALTAAINTVVFMVCHGSKSLPVKNFFEGVLSDSSRTVVAVPASVINFAKGWAEYCKEIYGGSDFFSVDGNDLPFEDMKTMITLLNSRKEDRGVISNKLVQTVEQINFGTGLYNSFVTIVWRHLAWSRGVFEKLFDVLQNQIESYNLSIQNDSQVEEKENEEVEEEASKDVLQNQIEIYNLSIQNESQVEEEENEVVEEEGSKDETEI